MIFVKFNIIWWKNQEKFCSFSFIPSVKKCDDKCRWLSDEFCWSFLLCSFREESGARFLRLVCVLSVLVLRSCFPGLNCFEQPSYMPTYYIIVSHYIHCAWHPILSNSGWLATRLLILELIPVWRNVQNASISFVTNYDSIFEVEASSFPQVTMFLLPWPSSWVFQVF